MSDKVKNLVGRTLMSVGCAGLLSGCVTADQRFVADVVDPFGITRGFVREMTGNNQPNRLMIYVGDQWNDFDRDGFWNYNEVQFNTRPSRSRNIYVGAENTDGETKYAGWSAIIENEYGSQVKEITFKDGGFHHSYGIYFIPYSLQSGKQYTVKFMVMGRPATTRAMVGSISFIPTD